MLGGPLGPLQENKRGKAGAAPLKKAGKPQGVSREVYALLGSEGLPPEVRKTLVRPFHAAGSIQSFWNRWMVFQTSQPSDRSIGFIHGVASCRCLLGCRLIALLSPTSYMFM